MGAILDAFGQSVQPVVIGLVSVVVVAFFRWVSPSSRWARQIKRDIDIASALKDGAEREAWERRVEAQAERLRIYRENVSLPTQTLAWGAFALIAVIVLMVIDLAANGWRGLAEIGVPEILIGVAGLGTNVWLVSQLISGRSVSAYSSDRYPKWLALRRAEQIARMRRAKRDGLARRRVERIERAARQLHRARKRLARRHDKQDARH